MRPRPFLRAARQIPVVRDSHSRHTDLIARQDGRPKAKLLKFQSERLRGCNASGF
jgi:hypothetical protein